MFATKKNIKIFVLGLLLVEMFFTYAPAHAQTTQYAGVQQQLTDYLCTPNDASTNATAAQGDLYNCINRLYRFALVVASVFSVFMIVIAGYIYMAAEGNQESVDKAKSILVSSITSIVILVGGYVLLKFLNPDLIKFQPIQPPSVVGQSRSYGFGNVPASSSANIPTTSFSCPDNPCSQYSAQISAAATQISLPSGIDKAKVLSTIMYHESRCLVNVSSAAESCGLMQLKPTTANTFKSQCEAANETITCDWLKKEANAQKSICMAGKLLEYLSQSSRCGSDLTNILIGYAGGEAICKDNSRMTTETRTAVGDFLTCINK